MLPKTKTLKPTMPTIKMLVLGIGASLMFGCSSVEMADIPATANPREEIVKLQSEINVATTKNVDVLASDKFSKSQKYLNDAKVGLEKGDDQSDVLDDLRRAKGSLNEAYAETGDRASHAEGLFQARQLALQAGAGSLPELSADLASVDDEVSDIADELQSTRVDKLANYQNEYIDLERRAVILTQLGDSQALVNGLRQEDAAKKAPVTFKRAELSLRTAESIISSNVRNPNGFQAAVTKAKTDAAHLRDVMATIRQNGNKLEESVAIKMVAQKKTISGLEENIGDITAQSEANISTMEAENERLAAANRTKAAALGSAATRIQLQQAMEAARSEFSQDEAEAYQQGDNLVIRLKKVPFASGRADLPEESLPLLAKVLNVTKSLNTSAIRVEGHTDATGSEAINKSISQNRANAVATYFKANGMDDVNIESEGFGYRKPIATNKTKEGRALNRRVDVVIELESTVE